jgi:hypothetical protein
MTLSECRRRTHCALARCSTDCSLVCGATGASCGVLTRCWYACCRRWHWWWLRCRVVLLLTKPMLVVQAHRRRVCTGDAMLWRSMERATRSAARRIRCSMARAPASRTDGVRVSSAGQGQARSWPLARFGRDTAGRLVTGRMSSLIRTVAQRIARCWLSRGCRTAASARRAGPAQIARRM